MSTKKGTGPMSASYYDPEIVLLITYLDSQGRRRVKPPYKNRLTYTRFVLESSQEYATAVGGSLVGKSVSVNFPEGDLYRFKVNASAGTITIYDIPIHTLYEIVIIDPSPLPRSDNDPVWDTMPEESKRALIVAWSDLVCYAQHEGSADSDWGFMDPNVKVAVPDTTTDHVLKLISWRNNYGNNKSAYEHVAAPDNRFFEPIPFDYYFPPATGQDDSND